MPASVLIGLKYVGEMEFDPPPSLPETRNIVNLINEFVPIPTLF